MKPWDFRMLQPEQAAELHALYDVEQEVEQYYASEEMRRSDALSDKGSGSNGSFKLRR